MQKAVENVKQLENFDNLCSFRDSRAKRKSRRSRNYFSSSPESLKACSIAEGSRFRGSVQGREEAISRLPTPAIKSLLRALLCPLSWPGGIISRAHV